MFLHHDYLFLLSVGQTSQKPKAVSEFALLLFGKKKNFKLVFYSRKYFNVNKNSFTLKGKREFFFLAQTIREAHT